MTEIVGEKIFELALGKVIESGITEIVKKHEQIRSMYNNGKISFKAYWYEPYIKLIVINGTNNDIKPIKFVFNDNESKQVMNDIDSNFLNKNFVILANSYGEISVGKYYRTFHDGVGDSLKANFRLEYAIINKNSERDSFVDGNIVFSVNKQ